MEIIKLYDLVKKLLQEKEGLRGDDDLLYLSVCIKIFSKTSYRNITEMSVGEFFRNRKEYGLPTFESVSRCRRKVQEERPDLKPCKKIQEARTKREEEFYNWSKMKQGEFEF
jgi:hypothetical protein